VEADELSGAYHQKGSYIASFGEMQQMINPIRRSIFRRDM
jgi:hypothetical protein